MILAPKRAPPAPITVQKNERVDFDILGAVVPAFVGVFQIPRPSLGSVGVLIYQTRSPTPRQRVRQPATSWLLARGLYVLIDCDALANVNPSFKNDTNIVPIPPG